MGQVDGRGGGAVLRNQGDAPFQEFKLAASFTLGRHCLACGLEGLF